MTFAPGPRAAVLVGSALVALACAPGAWAAPAPVQPTDEGPTTTTVTAATDVIAEAGSIAANQRQRGSLDYHLPVGPATPISGDFGAPGPDWPGGHAGIDFNGETGDPVYAATAGRVFYAEFNYGGYGNLIMVHRFDGVETRYAHLSKILVRKGDVVAPGQLIGRMGATGDASGSHLHFEVRVGKVPTPTDPRSLWSGAHPGVPSPPPAWSCKKYGC